MNRNFVKAGGGWARVPACALLLAWGAGCTLFQSRTAGTGTHYDAPTERPTSPKGSKVRPMLVEVTTDANGAVTTVQFKRSSGSDVVDQHVADTIRASGPQKPSTITDAEITYSLADGFSEPKLLSTRPAPAP